MRAQLKIKVRSNCAFVIWPQHVVATGYRRLHVLLSREGWKVNHKRVYRLYRLQGLSLRLKTRKKRIRVALASATAYMSENPMLRNPLFQSGLWIDSRTNHERFGVAQLAILGSCQVY
jgi:hypothetical protein